MNNARWVQRAAFAGAAGLVVWALIPGMGARAAVAPPQTFTATATASGVEYTFDRKPGLSQVGDLIHGATPFATSTLGAGGVSTGKAASAYGGGAAGLPGLLCAAGIPCAMFPVPGGFPPPFPFEADAQYPKPQVSDATLSSNRTIGGGGAPLSAKSGVTHAEAHELSALADTTLGATQFLNGIISTGSSSTVTTQSINAAGAVVSTAESTVSNINLVNLIKIASVHSKATVVYDGVHTPQVTVFTTVSGAGACGKTPPCLGASIDEKGIHIVGSTNTTTLKILNDQLAFLINGAGITVKVIGATNTPGDHTVHPEAGGLLVSYDNTVAGVPKAPPAVEIPYCSKILKALLEKQLHKKLDPIYSQVPANLCSPPSPPDPNAHYFGTMTIGSAGTIVQAQSFDLGSTVSPGGGPEVIPGTGPTTTFTPGTPGVAGTPGTAGAPGTVGSIGETPQVAGNTGGAVGYVENLGNVGRWLKYFFPALMLAGLGVLAGRLGPAPARLPRMS